MIPRHIFRRLIDLKTPLSIAETGDRSCPSMLDIRHRAKGEIELQAGLSTMTGPTVTALAMINAYLMPNSGDPTLDGDAGALDAGSGVNFEIRSRKLRKPIKISADIVGNRTSTNYNDVAYIYTTIDGTDGALYEMHSFEGGLMEIETYSLKALPKEALTALAVVDLHCGRFDPEREFLSRYGQAELDREIARSQAEYDEFMDRLIAVLNKKTASR